MMSRIQLLLFGIGLLAFGSYEVVLYKQRARVWNEGMKALVSAQWYKKAGYSEEYFRAQNIFIGLCLALMGDVCLLSLIASYLDGQAQTVVEYITSGLVIAGILGGPIVFAAYCIWRFRGKRNNTEDLPNSEM